MRISDCGSDVCSFALFARASYDSRCRAAGRRMARCCHVDLLCVGNLAMVAHGGKLAARPALAAASQLRYEFASPVWLLDSSPAVYIIPDGRMDQLSQILRPPRR